MLFEIRGQPKSAMEEATLFANAIACAESDSALAKLKEPGRMRIH